MLAAGLWVCGRHWVFVVDLIVIEGNGDNGTGRNLRPRKWTLFCLCGCFRGHLHSHFQSWWWYRQSACWKLRKIEIKFNRNAITEPVVIKFNCLVPDVVRPLQFLRSRYRYARHIIGIGIVGINIRFFHGITRFLRELWLVFRTWGSQIPR